MKLVVAVIVNETLKKVRSLTIVHSVICCTRTRRENIKHADIRRFMEIDVIRGIQANVKKYLFQCIHPQWKRSFLFYFF